VVEKATRIELAKSAAIAVRSQGEALAQLLKRPGFNLKDLPYGFVQEHGRDILELLQTELRYEGYIRRQSSQVHAQHSANRVKIPVELDYATVPGLRTEARQKLSALRPLTIGDAARISGVTPSDLGIVTLWVHAKGGGSAGR
jgi:tRNA uridine 5-carboxymethylaminomethyl modification enzyme